MAWSIFQQGGGNAAAVGWAKQFLQMLGAPQTASNLQFVYDWQKAEGGGGKYNPLNQGPVPGHPELTTTGSQYGGGAADFASWQAGLQGAVDYLNMPNYTHVKAALMQGDGVAARNALFASPWAASHYGYGSAWPNDPIPGGVQAMPASYYTGGTSGATPADSLTDAGMCAWSISLPLVGSQCIITKTQVRAMLGGMLLGVGGVVTLFGFAVLVAYGFQRTGALNAVGKAASVVPGTAKVVSAAANGASKSAAKNNLKPVNERGRKKP